MSIKDSKKKINLILLIVGSLALFSLIGLIIGLIAGDILKWIVIWDVLYLVALLFVSIINLIRDKAENSKPIIGIFICIICSILVSAILIIYNYKYAQSPGISRIADLICQLFSLILCVNLLSLIFNKIRHNSPHNPFATIYSLFGSGTKWFLAFILTGSIISIFASQNFQEMINYHKLEQAEYGSVYCYYVIAKDYKGDQYTLPAEVEIGVVESDEEYVNALTGDPEIRSAYRRLYYIKKIYFHDNEILYFEEPLEFEKVDQTVIAVDNRENEWDITLTNRYTKNASINEISKLDTKGCAIWIIGVLLSLAQWFIWLRIYLIKENKYYESISDTRYAET